MVNRLFRYIDLFASPAPISTEKRLRQRMFIVLLFCSMLVIGLALFNTMIMGIFRFEGQGLLLMFFLLHILFLATIRWFPDYEWPCLLYLFFCLAFQFFDGVKNLPSLMNPSIQVMPIMLIFGYFCIIHPIKRIVLLSFVLILSMLAVLLIPESNSMRMANYGIYQAAGVIGIAAFYKIILTLLSLYFYVYAKKVTEKEQADEAGRRVQAIRLGEISSSLRALIPEFRSALQLLEVQVDAYSAQSSNERALAMRDMESELARMGRVSRSIGWIYRAYRHERIASTLADHLIDQVEVLLRGKLFHYNWQVRLENEIPGRRLHGPIPSVILLLLTLAEQLVPALQAQAQELASEDARIFSLSFKDHSGELGIEISWDSRGYDFPFERFERLLVSTQGFDSDYRLELIAELVTTCDARLEFSQQKELAVVRLTGPWLKPLEA